MNTLKNLYFRTWRPAVLVLSLVLLAYILYFHRLGSLLPGYNQSEIETLQGASNWHAIASNPVDAPYKVLVWFLTAILHHGVLMTRAVSALFGTLAVLVFFAVIKPWFSFRTAFLATILFATSAGFLHVARLGTPYVLQLGLVAFLGAILWYRRRQNHRAAIGYLVVLLCALLWYVPGMIWFELLGFALLQQGIRRQFRQLSAVHVAGYSLLFLATLAPLLAAGAHQSHILLAAAGLPATSHELTHFGSNFLHGLLSIGVRSAGDPLLWVGHAPLLNIVELVLMLLGVYYYLFNERSVRTTFLVGSLGISLVLAGFSANVGFTVLVPVLYLLVASGLNQLLEQWLTVFPRNPFAKSIGVGLVCIMLSFSVLYQVRSYFVAWPHSTIVRANFSSQHD